MGYFRKTIPKPFYIKTVEFWEFGNPNKTVEIEKNALN